MRIMITASDKINEKDDQTVVEDEEKVSKESTVDVNPFHSLANEILSAIFKCLGFDHSFSSKQSIDQDHIKGSYEDKGVVEEEITARSTKIERKRQTPPPLDGGGNPKTN
ncbi:uncharacterized protein LOC124923716 [Impatiens glandulifera]|uniref:uncharacterized protein LOC124923716 n=1 Tax=Impatiens glandulifera TaxID=253017 RepID=UPI001FB08E63|nr:uncharacterized protein LOC124923716 [Impatiens glandulifera]